MFLTTYFRNLPLLHITLSLRLRLTWRLLKFMQRLARKQYSITSLMKPFQRRRRKILLTVDDIIYKSIMIERCMTYYIYISIILNSYVCNVVDAYTYKNYTDAIT